jgi:hypothetical protein
MLIGAKICHAKILAAYDILPLAWLPKFLVAYGACTLSS